MDMEQADIRALKREWTISLAVVIGGFIIAIAVAAFLTFGQRQHALVPDQTQLPDHGPPHVRTAGDPARFCRTVLASAKAFGVVPGAGRLFDPDPRQTDQQGRYICDAQAGAAKYSIAADVVCPDIGKDRCVSIYNIAQDDGAVLYQRRQ
jgi:hypothetical protein